MTDQAADSSSRRIPAFLTQKIVTSPEFLLCCIYGLLQGFYVAVVVSKHEFDPMNTTVLSVFGAQTAIDLFVLLAGSILLSRTTRKTIPTFLFASIYLSLLLANVLTYHFGNALFEIRHLSLITKASIASFVGRELIAAVLAWGATCIVCYVASQKLRVVASARRAALWLVLPMIVWAGSKITPMLRGGAEVHQNEGSQVSTQLEYAGHLLLPSLFNITYGKNLLRPGPAVPSSPVMHGTDLDRFRTVLDRMHLPLGHRKHQDLGLDPFKRVILVFVESLSLDLLHCRNQNFANETTPFWCSPPIESRTFRNLWTTASPTRKAHTTLFSSHPNPSLHHRIEHPNSLVRLVAEHGYHTVFLRSASRYYGNGHVLYSKMGFQEIIGSEDFPEHLQPHIYGWGLEDQKLYEQLVQYLDLHRKDKLFVAVLGTDTHPLHGRDYRGPANDESDVAAAQFGNAGRFIRAVSRSDNDLRILVEDLKTRGLIDHETLVVLTADHSCLPNSVTRWIPGHSRSTLGRVPLVFLSGQELPEIHLDQLASQLDIAPTLAHLMDLPVRDGWWGHSLLAPQKNNSAIGYDRNAISIRSDDRLRFVSLKRQPNEPAENQLLRTLFRSVVVD